MAGKYLTWNLSNKVLNNISQRGSLKENKKCLKLNENKNPTYQTMQDETKTVLGVKFIVLNAYVGNKERYSTTI